MTGFPKRLLVATLTLSVCLFAVGWPAAVAPVQAQGVLTDTSTTSEAVAKATDFSIPSAPAFALLDVSPANVHTPAYPRDFKVDWVVNDDQLVSNLALEAAPVWIFGFKNVTASDYRDLNPVLRQLSSLDVSVATAQQSGNQFLSAALKINVYNAADPLADAARALVALGYRDQEANRMIRGLDTSGLSTEEIIRRALQGVVR